MSQSFNLELTAEAGTLEHVARVLHEAMARPPAGDVVNAVLTRDSGLWVSVSPPTLGDMFRSDFGLDPTATVDMQINGTKDLDPQFDDALALSLRLLELLPGDAMLHFDYISPWFLRRHGELLLSDEKETWPPEVLARLTVPYKLVPLQFSNP